MTTTPKAQPPRRKFAKGEQVRLSDGSIATVIGCGGVSVSVRLADGSLFLTGVTSVEAVR